MNARVEGAPEALRAIVEAEVAARLDARGAAAEFDAVRALRPARPAPTQRLR